MRKPAVALVEFSSAITELAANASPAVVLITLRVRVPLESGDKRRAGFVPNSSRPVQARVSIRTPRLVRELGILALTLDARVTRILADLRRL